MSYPTEEPSLAGWAFIKAMEARVLGACQYFPLLYRGNHYKHHPVLAAQTVVRPVPTIISRNIHDKMIPLPTVYRGAVINPQSLTSYDVLPNCLLAVSPVGEIEWIVDDIDDSMVQEVMFRKGCLEAEVISLKHGEFIIPGFIDTHTVSAQPGPFLSYPKNPASMHRKSRIWGCEFRA